LADGVAEAMVAASFWQKAAAEATATEGRGKK